jgi:hypothetical protein
MFPMCHIYFADRVIRKSSQFTILGSIYPDIISSAIGRDCTHYNTLQLYNYFKDEDVNMKDFSVGAITHGVDMKGLDYYSDENYPGMDKGYCFEKAKQIEKDVIDCCKIPEKLGLWKAHNFIEMAFDICIYRQNKWLSESLKNVLEDSVVIKYVSKELNVFLNTDQKVLEDKFKRFTDFIEYKEISESTMMKKYCVQLESKYGIIDVSNIYGSEIIKKSMELIKDEIDIFFDYTISQAAKVINKLE